MRKKRNNKTKNNTNVNTNNTNVHNTNNNITTTPNNDINNDNDNDINNDNDDNNVYDDINDDNLNNLCNNDKNKKGVNKNFNKKNPAPTKTLKTHKQLSPQEQRKHKWKQIPQTSIDNVIKCMLKELPGLNLQSQRIVQYLRLLYVSNQKHISALEKIQQDRTLSSTDILPVDDSISIKPVYYPKQINHIEVDQILTDKQSKFLNNIRNSMDKKQAFLDAGFAPSQTDILPIITGVDNTKFDTERYKGYKKVWAEYWKIKKQQSEASGITEDFILSGFKKQVEFNIKDLFDHNGNFKNINDLDDETAKQITEIKFTESKTTNNKTNHTNTTTHTTSLKVGNKDKARTELAKLQQGIFNHVNSKTVNHNHNVSGKIAHGHINVNELSSDELDKILMLDDNKEVLELDAQCYDVTEHDDSDLIPIP